LPSVLSIATKPEYRIVIFSETKINRGEKHGKITVPGCRIPSKNFNKKRSTC